ncbi:hypothetical protein CNMCM6805_004439 [Aspergillus fumigatiaffinis]|uniref:chitinase n=1 Tax=Aspergillus fumigatiaffinis TaxID=340414 RepID=A0A8H4GQU4_9EURO|nr:hypothetical protein CNMCM6805_004439 [Aspergillus fumigatiaffinis]
MITLADQTGNARTRPAVVRITYAGTTEDFCGSGVNGDVRNKVIGYYESWRANNANGCGMTPEEIPVEYLDQVNLAFLYIDPKDYHIIAMDDGKMAPDIYARIANLKTRNPDAKIWVSIGGWTFNDPGEYQSVFSKLAKDKHAAQTFADNLMEFLDKYGFDGVDLDWEYPGADDRGGSKEDVENYPQMLRILKGSLQGGNHYSKKWGLSITVPTSYWYLRWFDISALESEVDEFNLMAYDLHGRWDRDDPIGPYVYAHTNLTEIDAALDLFWRNSINPSKINLGLADRKQFYGRTYTLSTPLCATAGCEWKDPGPKGKCTDTAGILSYKEIQDIISESALHPTYDEEAGVYYAMYGKGGANWVSFDDAISFKAKIDLANKYGLGGVLIWAVDQDDQYYHALRGVTGKVEPIPTAYDGFGAFTLDECYITGCGKRCLAGDITMTKLNEDASGRGCDGEDHNARSFCCPARNAPDSSTCYWTGGPINCHGQCAAGEVSMVLDDYGDSGKRCTNGGKKVWCCPATNGQKAIQECTLTGYSNKCPSDKPQEMTSVGEGLHDLDGSIYQVKRKFCCPETPAYDMDQCGWHGDRAYCNDNECPLGQVELFRWSGWHEGLPEWYRGCSKGRQQAFCCPPPLSNGSAFLPVSLENLFPTAESFSDSYTTTYAEVFDGSPDETSHDVAGTDPDKKAFTWIVMVGEAEDVQSFDKRDGSHLEVFDCPDTHPDDFSVQRAKAVCVGGTDEDNNCEDILLGGVEGTVVRLPAHCGPDVYVRAVSFQRSSNSTMPHRLQKRHPTAYRVYDFHYDYDFHKLRRDGGEVYFRADLSNHPGYWKEVVAAAHDSAVKRTADNWRQLDRRFWSDSKEDWLKRFNSLLVQGDTGLKKHYQFNQCLFEATGVCRNADGRAKAYVYGELNTTMDMGMTLIGTLRNFQFSEAYSYFNQESFSMRMGAGFQALARMYFDSGWVPIGSFDGFGMNSYIKGIFTVNPYFKMDARVEADAYISAQATGEISISHDRFRYYLPVGLGNNPTSVTGDWGLDATMGPISGQGNIEAKAGGGLVIGFRPTIGVDLTVQFHGQQYANTTIALSTPGSVRYDAALSTKCSGGMQFDVTGQLDVDFAVINGLPGWSSQSYNWKNPSPVTLFSDCIPFVPLAKRELETNQSATYLETRSTTGSHIDVPDESSKTCAFSTAGIYCADNSGSADLDCDLNKLLDTSDGEDDGNDGALARRSNLVKRNAKKLSYCDKNGGSNFQGFNIANTGTIVFSNYPSSSELVRDYYPNAATYDAEDPQDCSNLNLIKLATTPQAPSTPAANNGRTYDSEHVLEAQTVQRFFNYWAKNWSQLQGKNAAVNLNARKYPNPLKGQIETIPWCQYIKTWWVPTKVPFNANNELGSVYPGYHWHYTDEIVLYASGLNTKIKQGWFSGNLLYHQKSMPGYIEAGRWDEVARDMKLHILGWKYYYFDEIKKTLVKQSNRIYEKLKELDEDGGIAAAVGDRNGAFDKAYIPQGLAALWKDWVRSEHQRVQADVKAFLKETAQKAYDLNRPQTAKLNPGQAHQSNDRIVQLFELYLHAVNNLQDWNIDWDMEIDDSDSGSGSDGDPMDTDSDGMDID